MRHIVVLTSFLWTAVICGCTPAVHGPADVSVHPNTCVYSPVPYDLLIAEFLDLPERSRSLGDECEAAILRTAGAWLDFLAARSWPENASAICAQAVEDCLVYGNVTRAIAAAQAYLGARPNGAEHRRAFDRLIARNYSMCRRPMTGLTSAQLAVLRWVGQVESRQIRLHSDASKCLPFPSMSGDLGVIYVEFAPAESPVPETVAPDGCSDAPLHEPESRSVTVPLFLVAGDSLKQYKFIVTSRNGYFIVLCDDGWRRDLLGR